MPQTWPKRTCWQRKRWGMRHVPRTGLCRNINLVDDEPVRQKDWMASVARALGKPIPASIPAEEAVAQAGQLWVESVTCSGRVKNEKAKAMGWKPQYPSIQQGLPAAIEAVRKG